MTSQLHPAARPAYRQRNGPFVALGVAAAMFVAAHGHAQAPQRPGDPSYVHESWIV